MKFVKEAQNVLNQEDLALCNAPIIINLLHGVVWILDLLRLVLEHDANSFHDLE